VWSSNELWNNKGIDDIGKQSEERLVNKLLTKTMVEEYKVEEHWGEMLQYRALKGNLVQTINHPISLYV
jgi:hypothetical protein